MNPPDESPMNHTPAEADEEPKAKECENVVEEEHDPESPNEIPEAATPQDKDLGWPITLRKGIRSCRTIVFEIM